MRLEPQTEYAERMATDAREIEYSQIMQTDTSFCETEELRQQYNAERGLPFTPAWQWWPKAHAKRKAPLFKPKAPVRTIKSRAVICNETGEIFHGVRKLALSLGIKTGTLLSYMVTEKTRYGKTYRYATEAEKGTL